MKRNRTVNLETTRIIGLCKNNLICRKCDNILSLDKFQIKTYSNDRKRPHYSSYCKDCICQSEKIYRIKNKDVINTKIKIKRDNDPSKHREANKKYRNSNPNKVSEIKHNYRIRKLNIKGSHTINEWSDLLNQYNNLCACCNRKVKLTKDHIIPISKGGTDDITNIQPLCIKCNSSKGNRISVKY